jgi:hypothetical protein bacD2_19332
MNKLLIIGMLLVFFAACEKDQIGRYDLEHYVYFTWTQEQDTTISFSHYPGQNQHDLKFEVNLTGHLLTNSATFKLKVVDSLTTASADQYDFNENPTFGINKSKDTITVTLINTPDLKDQEVSLAIAIVPNENFEPGFVGKRYITIHYNNKDYKPLWWNDIFKIYFGEYTPAKFSALVSCFDRVDFSGIEESVLRKYAMELKVYIKDNNLTEPDGSEIEIPVK